MGGRTSPSRGCGSGIWPQDDALISVWCRCRTWTTVSFPNGTQSWSWMRNEGKGGSKGSDGGLGSQSGVPLGWEPGMLREEGCSHITGSQGSLSIPPGESGTARGSSLSQPSRFPGGTSSGSGNRESYSGCSSECTKGKGFRSRNLKLPHFSLSQMMVRLGKGVSGGRWGCRWGGLTRSGVSPQWKVCSSPLTCPSSPLAGPCPN